MNKYLEILQTKFSYYFNKAPQIGSFERIRDKAKAELLTELINEFQEMELNDKVEFKQIKLNSVKLTGQMPVINDPIVCAPFCENPLENENKISVQNKLNKRLLEEFQEIELKYSKQKEYLTPEGFKESFEKAVNIAKEVKIPIQKTNRTKPKRKYTKRVKK